MRWYTGWRKRDRMTVAKQLEKAGLRVAARAEGQPAQWGVTTEVFARATRFRNFIGEVLTAAHDRPGLLAARLVALDGVPVHALGAIHEQGSTPYGIDEGHCLEWTEDGTERIDRRILSTLTAQVWPKSESGPSHPCTSEVSLVATNLIEGLEQFLDGSDLYRPLKDSSNQVALDAICWWHEALPPTLFAHQSGLAVLSALPRTTWARKASGLVASTPCTPLQADTDVGATGELLDAALESNNPDRSTLVLQLALDHLGEKHSPVDGVNKRAWALKILSLYSRAMAAGPITSLLIAWVADMCENGTVQQSNPAETTVQTYARRALIPLHAALSTLSIDLADTDWSPTKMALLYESLVASQSRGNQSTMRSALASFHEFLVRQFDVDPLHRPIRVDEPPQAPHAQVVWPHELARAIEWTSTHADQRVGDAAAIIMAIAGEAPCRSQELMRLRLRSIHFSSDALGEFVEIEIARDAHGGRLKTPSSQRRLTVREPSTRLRLAAWLETRRTQGATPEAFLFGDPSRLSDRYRPGVTISFVNRLLKAATGEPTINLHTLRHTSISNGMDAIWRSSSCVDVNPIEELAAHAGHASPMATLLTYSHMHETGIRLSLDMSMALLIPLDHREAAAATGLTPVNIRAKASRSGLSISELGWRLIRTRSCSQAFPLAQDAFSWHEPIAPPAAVRSAGEITFDIALAMVRGLLDSMTTTELSRRHGFDEEAVAVWSIDLTRYCTQRAHAIHPRKLAGSTAATPNLPVAIEWLGIDFSRSEQKKYRQMLNGLESCQNEQLLTDAVKSWEHCHRGDHISFSDGFQALNLFRLLNEVGVHAHTLRLCFQSLGSEDRDAFLMNRQMVIDSFEAAFGKQPRACEMTPSRNRPSSYLQWDSSGPQGATTGASGGSVAGLNSIMVGVKAFLLLKQKLGN